MGSSFIGGLPAVATAATMHCAQTGRAGIGISRTLKRTPSPATTPFKFELVINLGTARMPGLTILSALLANADEMLE
jgi:hypothetical protein